jgi:hypothetical protein
MLKVGERAAKDGLLIYLFGGTDEIIVALKRKLLVRYRVCRLQARARVCSGR